MRPGAKAILTLVLGAASAWAQRTPSSTDFVRDNKGYRMRPRDGRMVYVIEGKEWLPFWSQSNYWRSRRRVLRAEHSGMAVH